MREQGDISRLSYYFSDVLFNSLSYAWFLPLVFSVYWWMGRWAKGTLWQNRLLFAASMLFYGWWDPRFLILLLVSALVDFWVGNALPAAQSLRHKNILLAISLFVNLGMLGFFKYFNFFLGSLEKLLLEAGLERELPALSIVLPVGISFYTFQTLSYTLDVYRGSLKPTRSLLSFVTFVSFFPQLVAGPIERASAFLPQIEKPRLFSAPQAIRGLRLILWGMIKKVVVADMLAQYVQQVYAPGGQPNAVELMVGTVFFAIQIYCDFSGYSDIAIGSARLFGIELMVNFRLPYFAKSLREFWSRWHISLTTWFSDYLYRPLGGNRRAPARVAANILMVFLISGLWHGAALSFVIWGAIHGVFYLVERFGKLAERIPAWIYRWVMLGFVLLAWVFFRAQGAREAFRLLGRLDEWGSGIGLFHVFRSDLNEFLGDNAEITFVVATIGLLFLVERLTKTGDFNDLCDRMPRWGRWGMYYVLIVLLLLFGAYGRPQQFIYFQF